MRRGGPGLAALDRSLHSSAQYSTLGSELTTTQLNELRTQLDVFSTTLRQFAQQHRKDIARDPQFRHAFQQMCANIGVDPLAGAVGGQGAAGGRGAAGKLVGLWNDFLGLSDFQNELSIQIIDVCVSTRDVNGGYIEMQQLVRAINRMRTGTTAAAVAASNGAKNKSKKGDGESAAGLVTEDDVVRSIQLLKPLGSGYEVVELPNHTRMVRSVPKELDVDSTTVMALLSDLALPHSPAAVACDALGTAYITEEGLVQSARQQQQQQQQRLGPPASSSAASAGLLRWSRERAQAVVHGMVLDGLLWVDEGAHPPRFYALNSLAAQALGARG